MQNNKAFPTFKDSPAFKYFSHWLHDDGLIDAIDARIYHNFEFDEFGGMFIKEIAVSFFPLQKMRQLKYYDHPLYKEQQAVYGGIDGYTSHSGNDFNDWMKDGNIMPPAEFLSSEGVCLGYSPDGDFAFFKYFGFANIDYAKQALEQFAFIRECERARDGSIDLETLVETAAERKHKAEIRKIKSQIYAEEKERCLREFKAEIERRLSSGEMKCPKNVDMLFSSMLLNGHVAETNSGSMEFRKQWDQIAEKMIQDRDLQIRQRENKAFS